MNKIVLFSLFAITAIFNQISASVKYYPFYNEVVLDEISDLENLDFSNQYPDMEWLSIDISESESKNNMDRITHATSDLGLSKNKNLKKITFTLDGFERILLNSELPNLESLRIYGFRSHLNLDADWSSLKSFPKLKKVVFSNAQNTNIPNLFENLIGTKQIKEVYVGFKPKLMFEDGFRYTFTDEVKSMVLSLSHLDKLEIQVLPAISREQIDDFEQLQSDFRELYPKIKAYIGVYHNEGNPDNH